MYQSILSGAVFCISAYTDIKYRKINGAVLAVYFTMAAAGHLITETSTLSKMAIGILPGCFCLALSFLLQQALGYGDGLLIGICGISLGAGTCMEILFIGCFLVGMWALFLLARRADRKKEIPFVPFLLAGMLLREFA